MITVNLFHAPAWCTPCKQFKPTFDKVKGNYKYKSLEFREYDIDDDDNMELCKMHHIQSVPTLLITNEKGDRLYRLLGNIPINDLTKVLDMALEKEKES